MIIQSELRREREKKVSTERNEYKSHSKEMDKAGFYRFSRSPEKGPRRRGKNQAAVRATPAHSRSIVRKTNANSSDSHHLLRVSSIKRNLRHSHGPRNASSISVFLLG